MQSRTRTLVHAVGVFLVCALVTKPLAAQTLDELVRGLVREKVADLEKRSGMALTGSIPVRLEDEISLAVTEGWRMHGEVQQGVIVEDGIDDVGRLLQAIFRSITVSAAVGDRLRVVAQCPGCAVFRMSDGDDAASAVGSYEVTIERTGQSIVPISTARCRPKTTCYWYAAVLRIDE